ncbi:MAG: dihydrofolate reductase [Pseudonocardiales bacterium]|nr:MAG: dihydrofolate reductase [Pseudonocardiales bacterium]
MSDLIDTTEMYLRTVYELEEEGTVPLRARIAERLHQSGPTVSQTVARMARDGLLTVEGDRHLELTGHGRRLAVSVMRKHRLAELLLVNVIGLPWEEVHVEACRWEHVMSEQVERRLLELLGHPTTCPHGNPIPGLSDLGEPAGGAVPGAESLSTLDAAAGSGRHVIVRRISEQLQNDTGLMQRLSTGGVRPEAEVAVEQAGQGVRVRCGELTTDLSHSVAALVFVNDR